jgi:hypothetical protein
MTKKEQEAVNTLLSLVRELRAENDKFRSDIKNEVTALRQHREPLQLEAVVLKSAGRAISESIVSNLTKYNSPLTPLVESVVDSNRDYLRETISSAFDASLKTEDFKEQIVAAFSHKVARTLISNNTGLFDKVSNELKQDATFKSKLTLAVANVVEDCLVNK